MKHILLTASLILAISTLYSPAYAGQSLNDAAQSVKQRTGGRILSTKTVQSGSQRVHKIKVLLPSGKVQTFTVSAQ